MTEAAILATCIVLNAAIFLAFGYFVGRRYGANKESESRKDMKVQILYHDTEMPRIERYSKGDWIDLRTAEEETMHPGESKLISLGISIKLPEGYEAHLAMRSSTFKKYGIILTNAVGVIDQSYCGDGDIWKAAVYATRETTIPKYERICQFRVMEKQPELEFEETETLGNPDRGGFGSSDTSDEMKGERA